MKEKRFRHTRKPHHWQRQGWGGGKLWSHGGELNNRGAEGKAERFPHKGSLPASPHQPERLVCSPARMGGGWGFGGHIPGRGLGLVGEHSLKRASAPQLAGRVFRKKSGPA